MEELTVSKPVVGYVLGGGVWTRATTLKLTDGEMPPSNSLHHDFFETLAGLGWIWGDTATGNNIDIYVTSNTRTQSDFGTKIADLVATSGSGKKATRIVIPVTRAIPQAFDKTDLPHCLVLTKSFDTLLAAEYQERGKKSGTAKQHSDRTVGVEISGADWALQALTLLARVVIPPPKPQIMNVAVIHHPTSGQNGNTHGTLQLAALTGAASLMSTGGGRTITITPFPIVSPTSATNHANTDADVTSKLASIPLTGSGKKDAVIVLGDVILGFDETLFGDPSKVWYYRQIADYMNDITRKVPTMGSDRRFTQAGGLLSFGPNAVDAFHRAAAHLDLVLRGVAPSDIPREHPWWDLSVNVATAKRIGVTIPEDIQDSVTSGYISGYVY